MTAKRASTPRLSVVVPFYGVEAYIGACLESLRVQTFSDFEVILVDDGSPDGSRAIAQRYAERDSRFHLVTKANGGLGPARNTGAEHAVGSLITFVDSDDLLTVHAYEWMVQSLDSSGSSFVGGNARRFNRSTGVKPSWSHRRPFAKTKQATHIEELPTLALDRMIWNKVYRREFWDEYAYEFPPIRYEDYPVTLRAHLEALTVDVLQEPVYYWRERESGDSITQQAFHLDNLSERVQSAEMVLDIANRASPRVRDAVAAALAEIDLVTVNQAFETAPDEEADHLLDLGLRLMERLPAHVLGERPRFDRLQHAALARGEVGLLRELAGWRTQGKTADEPLRINPRAPWQLESERPGLGSGKLPRELYRMPRSSIRLRTTLVDVEWSNDGVTLRGDAHILHQDASDSDELTVQLQTGSVRMDFEVLETRIEITKAGRKAVAFVAHLRLDKLRELPLILWPARIYVELHSGRTHRRGPLTNLGGGSPWWPGLIELNPGVYVSSSPVAGVYALKQVRRPVLAHDVSIVAGPEAALVISGSTPEVNTAATIELRSPASGNSARFPVELAADGRNFVVELPAASVFRTEVPLDPYTMTTIWDLHLVTADSSRPLLYPNSYAAHRLDFRGSLLSVAPTMGGWLRLEQSPPRVTCEAVRVDGGLIVADGRCWPEHLPTSMAWRSFLPNSDDYSSVPCTLTQRDGVWRAETPVTDLTAAVDGSLSDQVRDWVLFVSMSPEGGPQALTHLPTGDEDESVVCSGAAQHALPQWQRSGGTEVRLVTVRDTLHILVGEHAPS